MRVELQYHSVCVSVCVYVCMAICHSNFSKVKNICLVFLLHLWHRFVDSYKYSFCEYKKKEAKYKKLHWRMTKQDIPKKKGKN